MPLFVFHGLDVAGGPDIRKVTRAAHLDWLESLRPRVKMAGPMLADDSATPVGSVVVIEAAALGEAKAIFAADPYAAAGLWTSADVRPFNWIIRQDA